MIDQELKQTIIHMSDNDLEQLKDFVGEALLERYDAIKLSASKNIELNDKEKNYIDNKAAMSAIVSYRQRTGFGLKEAVDKVKDYINALR